MSNTINSTLEQDVFKATLSKRIIWSYWLMLIVVIAIFSNLLLQINIQGSARFVAVSIVVTISWIMLSIIYRAYTMSFVISQGQIIIHGIFWRHVIQINDIEQLKLSTIPRGFRLFGASFLGGYYYLPGIGRARVMMGNFKDGVLIGTRNRKHYIITPQNPNRFLEKVNASRSGRQFT